MRLRIMEICFKAEDIVYEAQIKRKEGVRCEKRRHRLDEYLLFMFF